MLAIRSQSTVNKKMFLFPVIPNLQKKVNRSSLFLFIICTPLSQAQPQIQNGNKPIHMNRSPILNATEAHAISNISDLNLSTTTFWYDSLNNDTNTSMLTSEEVNANSTNSSATDEGDSEGSNGIGSGGDNNEHVMSTNTTTKSATSTGPGTDKKAQKIQSSSSNALLDSVIDSTDQSNETDFEDISGLINDIVSNSTIDDDYYYYENNDTDANVEDDDYYYYYYDNETSSTLSPSAAPTKQVKHHPKKSPSKNTNNERFNSTRSSDISIVSSSAMGNDMPLTKDNLKAAFGVLVSFFVILMIFTAKQMKDNPHGICAGICNISILLATILIKMICLPCRFMMNRHYQGREEVAVNRMIYSDRNMHNDLRLELT